MTFTATLERIVALIAEANTAGQPLHDDVILACTRYMAGMPRITEALYALERTPKGGIIAQWSPDYPAVGFVPRWDAPELEAVPTTAPV